MPILAGNTIEAADIAAIGITRIQRGSYSATITASTSVITTVTFPEPFTALPIVIPICRTGAGAAVGSFFQITVLSTTSVNIRWGLPASGTATCTVDWIAIQ